MSDIILAFFESVRYNTECRGTNLKFHKVPFKGRKAVRMNTVNYGDKYTKRLTLRISERQLEWLVKISEVLGVSPSDYLRMVINTSMISTQKSVDTMLNGMVGMPNNGERIGGNDEHVKTDSDNLI